MESTKKMTLFFILFFFCISCSDNEKTNYPAPTGTWEVVIYEGHDSKGRAFPIDGIPTQFTFKSDGTGISLMGISYENEYTFTWFLNRDMLSIKYANGNIETYQIIEYSENLIRLLQFNEKTNETISTNFIKNFGR
ncbi:lipocalin family protein [uncultured Bacteroides sp.]|uniref:lipocalin family protein n=1 Tax=uncultured Bacteroides sp. TaxID=162156 RepID=UPI002AAB148C|nr:lipocalin family protein [uncultured Bacteroides sp.]